MSDPLSIFDLRGGVNDTDVPIALAANEITDCRNIDWFDGLLARKRDGTAALSLSGSILATRAPSLVVTSSGSAVASSLSFSHGGSSGSGLSPKLVVAIVIDRSAGQTVTAATYDSAAMTLVASLSDSGNTYTVLLYTATALTLTKTIAITTSAASTIGAIAHTFANCASVGSTTGTVAYGSSNGLRTTTGVGTMTAGQDAMFAIFAADGAGYVGPGPGQRVGRKLTTPESFVTSYEIDRLESDGTTHLATTIQHAQGATGTAVLVWAVLVGLSVSALAGSAGAAILGLWRSTPTDDVTADELWAVDEFGRLGRYVSGAWADVRYRNKYAGAFDTGIDRYYVNGASLHGKFFLTARTAPYGYTENFTTAVTAGASPFTAALTPTYFKDRNQVFDGTALRLAGLDAPRDALSAADSGGAGAFATTRYYRYRYAEQTSAGVVIRRSEPSASVTFIPSLANASATVTKEAARLWYDVGTTPAAAFVKVANGETHWEVEESIDNVTFYRIASVAVATLTYADTLTAAQVTTTGTLSEAVGEYAPLPSSRHVVVDDDRVMIGGTKDQDALTAVIPTTDSAVRWTPVETDDGVGNDERVPATITTRLNLDPNTGGNIRAMLAGEHGVVHVFKRSSFFRLVRTGQDSDAYESITESRIHGALMNAVAAGHDADGKVAVYFLDPTTGLGRIGAASVELLMDRKLRRTWRRRNTAADPVLLLSYRDRGQLWTWCALDSETVPNRLTVFDRRLSAFSFHDGNIATVLSATLYPDSTGTLRPFLGSSRLSAIQRADTGTNDDGTYFRGYVTTKPFLLGGLARKFGLTGGVLHVAAGTASGPSVPITATITRSGATATVTTGDVHGYKTGDSVIVTGATQADYNSATDAQGFLVPFPVIVTGLDVFTYQVANAPTTPATGSIFVYRAVMVGIRILKDYGKETAVEVDIPIMASGSETRVTRILNDLVASGLFAVQLELGDPTAYSSAQLPQQWVIDGLVVGVSPEESVIGG